MRDGGNGSGSAGGGASAPSTPSSASGASTANSIDAQLRSRKLLIASVVATYFVISISLVFLNKVLMDRRWSMEAPLFMTAFQCTVTVAICWILGEIGARSAPGSWFAQFPRFAYRLDVARKLLPLSIVFVGMITFNNLCLKYVEVSFYNVARSLTIVFNVIFTYFMLGTRTSAMTLGCLAIVVLGFFVGSEGEVNFSLIGTLFGVTSSVFVSLNSILTKKNMDAVGGNEWALAGYNNLNALLLFIPIIPLSGETAVISRHWYLFFSGHYWTLMTLGGMFGFAIGIVTIMQIKVTSALTHNISGTAKACVQTVLALMLWRNQTNATNMAGVLMVLLGSAAYSYVRTGEMEAEAQARKARAAAAEAAAPTPVAGEFALGDKPTGNRDAVVVSVGQR